MLVLAYYYKGLEVPSQVVQVPTMEAAKEHALKLPGMKYNVQKHEALGQPVWENFEYVVALLEVDYVVGVSTP